MSGFGLLPDVPFLAIRDGRFGDQYTWYEKRSHISSSKVPGIQPVEYLATGKTVRREDGALAEIYEPASNESKQLRILPNDVCRCHDDGCSEREQCLRYLQRNNVGERTPYCPSLFPYDIPIGNPCPNKIEA